MWRQRDRRQQQAFLLTLLLFFVADFLRETKVLKALHSTITRDEALHEHGTKLPFPFNTTPQLPVMVDPDDTMLRFNASNVSIVYHIGKGGRYGRTNNQILCIIHALDAMFDNHGEISFTRLRQNHGNDSEEGFLQDASETETSSVRNYNAVVAVSRWAATTLRSLFPRLGLQSGRLPLVYWENFKANDNATIINFRSKEIFLYNTEQEQRKKNITGAAFRKILEHRRHLVLSCLFQHVSRQNLQSHNLLQAYLKEKKYNDSIFTMDTTEPNSMKQDDDAVPYFVVHSRSLEGSCESRLIERYGDQMQLDECYMSPTYIKRILRPYGLVGRIPIVVITDMQNLTVLTNLQRDPEIGHQVVIPALEPHFQNQNSIEGDMMIACLSNGFVGTRVSSMASNIALFRVVLGAAPQSNFVDVNQESSASDGNSSASPLYEVCESCVYGFIQRT